MFGEFKYVIILLRIMSDDQQRNLYHTDRLSYEKISHCTLYGLVLGIPSAIGLHYLNIPRTPFLEWGVRLLTGGFDSLAETFGAVKEELPKILKKSKNTGGSTVYYMAGKFVGGILFPSAMDYILRHAGVDVHAYYTGFLPALYSRRA